MIKRNPQLTFMQYIFLIHGVQVGIGMLTLPRKLADSAGTDGWISLIICWFLAIIFSFIIIQVMKKYPNGTIIDLVSHYFGKWTGKLIAFIFALYFGLLTLVIYIREALFIQMWILPYSKLVVLMILIAVPCYMIVCHEIHILGRYSQFIFFMTFWLIFIILLPLKYANWLHLLPVFKEGWSPIFSGIKTVAFSFLGFEIAFFLYPYLEKKEKAFLGVVIANSISLFSMLLLTIIAFLYFSPDEIKFYSEPPMVMLKIVEFRFIERLEIIFFSFYLFVISTTIFPYMFMTALSARKFVNRFKHHHYVFLFLIALIAYVFFVPPTFDRNNSYQKVAEYAGIILVTVFPLLLWGILSMKGLRKGRKME